ncbi:MAG: hypothetical protein P8H59_09845 [Flavobacteriales bacterium]|nr:hypothetical protein [Flavobacteriales bacterium]MDG1781243.1 hypothetical protein [Flavobacteriales bacterium]
MKNYKTYLLQLVALSFILTGTHSSFAQFYNGSQQEFGKNRVQYRDFFWQYYPGDRYDVYYYEGGKELAAYTLQSVAKNLEDLEKFFDFTLEERIQVILYHKQNEFRQSNVGITGDDAYNIGGSTRIVGSKIFMYYTGDYDSFEEDLRTNISRVLFSQMMYAGDWKDVIKNSTLLTIPEWYQEGLLSYSSEPWNAEKAAFIKDGIQSGKYNKFNRLEGKDAVYVGHAMWKYIADVYGENVIPNILYMTRINRNIESGYLFVLGTSLNTLSGEFINYYSQQFDQDEKQHIVPVIDPIFDQKDTKKKQEFDAFTAEEREAFFEKKWKRQLGELPVKGRKKYDYNRYTDSPNGEWTAFTTNELGQYKVWLYNKKTGKKKRILKGDHKLERLVDDTYPILAWHPTSRILSYTYEDKGDVFIGFYNLDEKKHNVRQLFRMDKVMHMAYSPDGRKMIFSGVYRGQTDLYLYQVIGNNQEALTKDIYDDMHPQFIRNGEAVIFASNRPDDTLRVDPLNEPVDLKRDIYVYSLNSEKLERITETPEINESKPFEYDSKHYTYLAEENGFQNRYLASIDSVISRIDTTIHYRYFTVQQQLTNFATPPIDYQFNSVSGDYSMTFVRKGKRVYFNGNKSSDLIQGTNANATSQTIPDENGKAVDMLVFKEEAFEGGEVNIDDYRFEDDPTDFEYEKESVTLNEDSKGPGGNSGTTEDSTKKAFELSKPRNYRLNFATDYVLTQIDNTFSNPFYQPFTGPTTMFPGLSGLVKLGMSDLFEDYKVVGGFRLSGSLDNNDYGISFENLKGRVDKRIRFMRQANRQLVDQFSIVQVHSHTGEYQIKYPFDELTSVRISGIFRQDRRTFLSTDPTNLSRQNVFTNNVGARAEYVYDNTISKGLNLYNGTRYKFWGEYYVDPQDRNSAMSVLGFDIRHYERIHRDLIFAVRFAGSTSLGSKRLVYYLGGVDNWLNQKIDEGTPIADDQNYQFQTLAAPMRGFFVNARNGNSFAVINAETRWPIVKYFSNTPLKSDFLENFQIVGFTDVGSAWTGLHPYADDNRFNQVVFEQNPLTVTVDNNREPVVWGYGFGLRSRLLGYFVRADWSWGVDDGIILDSVFSISLSTDF